MSSEIHTRIREEVLRDPRYPLHRIADKLLPYLQLLADRFQPERVILFGSFAHGNPHQDSDVDLLVLKTIEKSPTADATAIRKALRPLRHMVANFSLDIMVRAPDDFRSRVERGSSFHADISENGIVLI